MLCISVHAPHSHCSVSYAFFLHSFLRFGFSTPFHNSLGAKVCHSGAGAHSTHAAWPSRPAGQRCPRPAPCPPSPSRCEAVPQRRVSPGGPRGWRGGCVARPRNAECACDRPSACDGWGWGGGRAAASEIGTGPQRPGQGGRIGSVPVQGANSDVVPGQGHRGCRSSPALKDRLSAPFAAFVAGEQAAQRVFLTPVGRREDQNGRR